MAVWLGGCACRCTRTSARAWRAASLASATPTCRCGGCCRLLLCCVVVHCSACSAVIMLPDCAGCRALLWAVLRCAVLPVPALACGGASGWMMTVIQHLHLTISEQTMLRVVTDSPSTRPPPILSVRCAAACGIACEDPPLLLPSQSRRLGLAEQNSDPQGPGLDDDRNTTPSPDNI